MVSSGLERYLGFLGGELRSKPVLTLDQAVSEGTSLPFGGETKIK
jgi:hypothetical protein